MQVALLIDGAFTSDGRLSKSNAVRILQNGAAALDTGGILGDEVNRSSRVAFCLLVLSCRFGTAAAHSDDPRSAASKSDDVIISCVHARSGSMTAALVCENKAEAERQLDEAGCFVGDAPAVAEVRLYRRSSKSGAPD